MAQWPVACRPWLENSFITGIYQAIRHGLNAAVAPGFVLRVQVRGVCGAGVPPEAVEGRRVLIEEVGRREVAAAAEPGVLAHLSAA